MAETRPLKVPTFNTGGANRAEPAAGKKTLGWVLNEEPASSFFNWLHFYTGAWLAWIDERMFDGGDEEDLTITAPVVGATDAGGALILKAADGGATSGVGGNMTAQGGDAVDLAGQATIEGGQSSAAGGGSATLRGGTAVSGNGGGLTVGGGFSTTGGDGGAAKLEGGNAIAGEGGAATVEGGNSGGTDQNAGSLTLSTGNATGSGSGDTTLQATKPGASGTATRSPSDFLVCDGNSARLYARERLEIQPTATVDAKGDLYLDDRALPGSPVAGAIMRASGGLYAAYNGDRWSHLENGLYVEPNQSDARGSTGSGFFELSSVDIKGVIPADALQDGSVVRLTGWIEQPNSAPGSLLIGSSFITGTGAPAAIVTLGVNIPFDAKIEAKWAVRTAGAVGSVVGDFIIIGHSTANIVELANATSAAVDTTGAIDVGFTASWIGSDANAATVMKQFTVEVL